MRIVLDTSILVRAHEGATGPARELLLRLIESDHALVSSDAMLHELAKVLRYPRLVARHNLTEDSVYRFITLLRDASEIVAIDPLLITPVRDVNDTVVMQTAIIGEADVLCTNDADFFGPPALPFLQKAGIEVLDDLSLLQKLRR